MPQENILKFHKEHFNLWFEETPLHHFLQEPCPRTPTSWSEEPVLSFKKKKMSLQQYGF